DQEMVDHVFALSERGVRLGLLSNIPHELADLFAERFPHLLALFPVLGLSCRIGSAKPEPDAFAWCLRGLELPAEQVLFVDDSERNVLAARDLGLGAHHFSSLEGLRAAMSGTNCFREKRAPWGPGPVRRSRSITDPSFSRRPPIRRVR